MKPSLYKLLNISQSTDQKEIKQAAQNRINQTKVAAQKKDFAFLKVSQNSTPEQLNEVAKLHIKKIKEAYIILSNPEARQSYDKKLQDMNKKIQKVNQPKQVMKAVPPSSLSKSTLSATKLPNQNSSDSKQKETSALSENKSQKMPKEIQQVNQPKSVENTVPTPPRSTKRRTTRSKNSSNSEVTGKQILIGVVILLVIYYIY